MASPVDLAIRDGVATLTLNDGKANALSLPMAQAIDAGLDRAAEARVVVIRGRPGVLCGGFDLKVIRGGSAEDRAAMTGAGYRLLSRLYLLPTPLVFACTGHAVAAGALLLLTGDVRIGVRGEFRIGLNETALSLADVSNKAATKVIATASYPKVAYAHQGWFSEDQRFFEDDAEKKPLRIAHGLEGGGELFGQVVAPIVVKVHDRDIAVACIPGEFGNRDSLQRVGGLHTVEQAVELAIARHVAERG